MSDATIPFFFGALVAAGVVRLFFIWLLRKWNGSYWKALATNALSLAVITLVAGWGLADGGEPVYAQAFMSYVIPQIVWLAFDLGRASRDRKVIPTPQE
jgi:hypothetical protein